ATLTSCPTYSYCVALLEAVLWPDLHDERSACCNIGLFGLQLTMGVVEAVPGRADHVNHVSMDHGEVGEAPRSDAQNTEDYLRVLRSHRDNATRTCYVTVACLVAEQPAKIPRSAGKSRADGARQMPTVQVTSPPAQELEGEDVILARVTHAQWMDMLTQEDGDETVGEIMEELLSKVMEGCLNAYVKRQEAEILQVPAQTTPRVENQCTSVTQKSYSPMQSENETSPKSPVSEKRNKARSPQPRSKTDQKKKQGANLSPKPVPGKFLPALPCSAGKKDTEVQNRNRVDLTYNQKTGPGNQPKDYQPIPRLDPSCLPQHCMVPQYEIVDKPNSRKPSGLSKLQPKYNRQQTDRTPTILSPLSSRDQLAMFQRRNKADVSLKKVSPLRHSQEGMEFSGPLRLDTMVLAKGVSLQDPQRVESNPLKSTHPSTSTKLRPIRSDAAVPLFSVDQITACRSSQVTPLFQSKN
ncbi:hypothetical protein INR49_006101, partial [Caranx melampygus]